MADLDLKKYKGGGGITVLNRGGEYLYSYGTEKLIKQIEGLSGVADGNWFIGNLSKEGGGSSLFSNSHETGMDVDVAIPLKGGKSSANDSNWAEFPAKSTKAFKKIKASPESKKWYSWKKSGKLFKERKESLPGALIPDAFKKELEKYTTPSFESSGEMDSYKSAQLMKYFVDKGFKLIFLNRELYNNIAYDFHKNLEGGSISPDDELLKFIKEYIPNKLSSKSPVLADKKGNHGDHFHIRLEGSGKLGDPKDRKAGEDSDSKEREKEREKAKDKIKRLLFLQTAPLKFKNDFKSGGFEGSKEVAEAINKTTDFKRWFLDWMFKVVKREIVGIDGELITLDDSRKKNVYANINKYIESNYNKSVINTLSYEVIAFFVEYYNDDGRKYFKQWFKSTPYLPENKRNQKMKITKERLAQIIKEEVEAYNASQISELDVDELKDAEAYIKEVADLLKSTYETIFKGAAPAIGTPQTKADTDEPVTDQTAHEDAKAVLLDLLGDAIDEFQQKEPELNEDGHDDVPSAVRAMKTMAEDALEMLDALEQMDGSLPTWWTNKMAVSASMLNKMRDYLLVPSMEEEMDEQ